MNDVCKEYSSLMFVRRSAGGVVSLFFEELSVTMQNCFLKADTIVKVSVLWENCLL